MTKQMLADIVKSKRDAALAKKNERELAKKKREREERKSIAAAEKAKELSRIEREKKKLLKVAAERKAETLKRAAIKKILSECLSQAIDGNVKIAVNESCLSYLKDFEELGFIFKNQIEHTKDVATLLKEKQSLSVKLAKQNLDIASSKSSLERYLKTCCISIESENYFQDGLSALKAFIYKKDDLQLDVDYWANIKRLAPWKLREVHTNFSHLSDAMTISAVEQKRVFAENALHEHAEWERDNCHLHAEMKKFIEMTIRLMKEHASTEKKLAVTQELLSEDEETLVTYMSWEKKPTSNNTSIEYKKINWFCSRESKMLFTQISDYLMRNASKSEARFIFKINSPDDDNTLTVGRNAFSLPEFVSIQDVVKKIKKYFGFKAKLDKSSNNTKILVTW